MLRVNRFLLNIFKPCHESVFSFLRRFYYKMRWASLFQTILFFLFIITTVQANAIGTPEGDAFVAFFLIGLPCWTMTCGLGGWYILTQLNWSAWQNTIVGFLMLATFMLAYAISDCLANPRPKIDGINKRCETNYGTIVSTG
jgi:hypothetical protein